MKKLAIVTTHPIQYNAPWFQLLEAGGKIKPKVFYTWGQLEYEPKHDPGFGREVQWDIPLLEGYQYCFVKNISTQPGSHHGKGIINPTLNEEIEQWQADAVLVFGWNFISHLKCIKYFHKKIPVLFRGDSTLLRKQSFLQSFAKNIYLKWVYHFVDYALFVGTENKKYFIKHGMKESQLIFAPHAVDNHFFFDTDRAFENEASQWRLQLGIKESELVILFAGKFEPIKNLFWLVRFAERFAGMPVKFLLVGNGPLAQSLKRAAGSNASIIFLGFQNQKKMPVVYRLAQLFMLCSVSETWGLTVNEAMACERAILVSDSCGCANDLVGESNGIVFKTARTDELFNKIWNKISDLSEWEEMGLNSGKLIQKYSFNNIVTAVENLLLEK